MASFDTTVRQMTEMFQWAKYLSKKWPKCLIEKKKNSWTVWYEWYSGLRTSHRSS